MIETSGWQSGLPPQKRSPNRVRTLVPGALFFAICGWGSLAFLAQMPPQASSAPPAQSQDVSAEDVSANDTESTSVDDPDDSGEQKQAELSPKIAQAIVEQTNAFRQRNDQKALSDDDQLAKTAEAFAKFMAANDKYGHRADGRTPAERAKANGYEYCVVRENIAFRRGSSLEDRSQLTETFVQGWIDSAEHRENMLADYITETGVAVATTDQQTFYAVQMFGRPKTLRFEVELTNQTDGTHELTLEHDGNTDSFELPPRVRLKVTRCLPTNFILNDDEKGLTLQESAELSIVSSADNQAELQRAGKSSDE